MRGKLPGLRLRRPHGIDLKETAGAAVPGAQQERKQNNIPVGPRH